MPKSILQMNTVFLSILIEALPFVLIGSIIAGMIQVFVSEQMIAKIIPKNKVGSVIVASLVGFLFPSCECGIVPIVRKLIAKGVPTYAGIAFMLTAPIINPIVLFATYIAFGNNWKFVWGRALLAILVANIVGLLLAYFFPGNQLKIREIAATPVSMPLSKKIWHTLTHAVDEFFDTGKYLILGALIAAAIQTYVHTATLLNLGQGKMSGSLVMMALGFILNLCSEADAFIASSFRTTFSTSALVAFLVYSPMIDLKNVMMMLGSFKTKFVVGVVAFTTVAVFVGSLFF